MRLNKFSAFIDALFGQKNIPILVPGQVVLGGAGHGIQDILLEAGLFKGTFKPS